MMLGPVQPWALKLLVKSTGLTSWGAACSAPTYQHCVSVLGLRFSVSQIAIDLIHLRLYQRSTNRG